MKILVTGGLGYIGSHAVVALLQRNFEVIIADNLSNSEAGVWDAICQITAKRPIFYEVDLKDGKALEQLLQLHEIQACMHFAAFKSVGESELNPMAYYENNIGGLLSLLAVLKKTAARAFIFSSSCTVYGQADDMPIRETTPLKQATSCYGRTKQMGEDILRDYARSTGTHLSLLRYFNPIGAHSSGLIGELPTGIPNNLIPFVAQTAAGIREELKIFGSDYPTADGTAMRDYIHVEDLAEAHVQALEKLLDANSLDPTIDVYNLGTGTGSTVLQLINAFEKATQQEVKYSFDERRAGDISVAYASTDKAEAELQWRATTSLEKSLSSTWNWQKKLMQRDLKI